MDTINIKRKIDDLKKYVPYINRIIEILQEDVAKKDKLNHIQLFYNILTDSYERTTLNILKRCEHVLRKYIGQEDKTSIELNSALLKSSSYMDNNDISLSLLIESKFIDEIKNEIINNCIHNDDECEKEPIENFETKQNDIEKINKDQICDEQIKKMNSSEDNNVNNLELNKQIKNIDNLSHKTQSAQNFIKENIEISKVEEGIANNFNVIRENSQMAPANNIESNVEKKINEEVIKGKLKNDNNEITRQNTLVIETKFEENNDEKILRTNTINVKEDSGNSISDCELEKSKLDITKTINEKENLKIINNTNDINPKLCEASPICENENSVYSNNDEIGITSESNSKSKNLDKKLKGDDDQLNSEVELIKYATEKLKNWDGNELTTDSESEEEEEVKSFSEKSENGYYNNSIFDSESEEQMKHRIYELENIKNDKGNRAKIEEKCADSFNSGTEGQLNCEIEEQIEGFESVDNDESENKLKPELIISEIEKSESNCKNENIEFEQKNGHNLVAEDKGVIFKEVSDIEINEITEKSNECDVALIEKDTNENVNKKCNKFDNISLINKSSVMVQVEKEKEEKKNFEESNNDQDPLLLDKEFENHTNLSKLVVLDFDIHNLLKDRKERKKEQEQQEQSPSSSSILNIANNEKRILSYSKVPKEKEKQSATYSIKKDSVKSIETIELLDSDDENKYNDDDDDDVILVSAQGLKKKNKNFKNVTKSNETVNNNKITSKMQSSSDTDSSLFCTSSTSMFAIKSVQSFGIPKPTTSGSAVKSTITAAKSSSINIDNMNDALTEDEIASFSAIKKFPNISISKMSSGSRNSNLNRCDNTVNSVTIKKNVSTSTGNEYKETLRVCEPVKEPITLNTRDFLSVFQNFSATKSLINKSVDIKVNKDNKLKKRNSLSCQSTQYDSSVNNKNLISRKSIDCCSSLPKLNAFNKNKYQDQVSNEWLNNFVTNLLSPEQTKSKYVLEILQKCLTPVRYHQLKTIIDSHNNPNEVFSYIVSEKVLKLLPNGQTTESVQLIVKPINEVDIDNLNQEIRELFIKNGTATEIGNRFCEIAHKGNNKVLTTDSRNGQVTSRSRKITKHERELDDDEYEPNVSVNVDQETTQERRRSLRRDNRMIDWKSYFTYDEEDDDIVIAHQLKKPKIEKKIIAKRPSSIKRVNGEQKVPTITERKKIKIEGGTSMQTSFDTNLLTPLWFENEDPEESNSQSRTIMSNVMDQHYDEVSSYVSTNYLDNYKTEEKDTKNFINKIKNEIKKEKISVTTNINPAYHCRSKYVDACLICGEKVQHAVSHYVNEHPNREVIISRITQSDVDYILKNVNCALISNQKEGESIYGRAYQYTAFCVFCNRDMKFALRYWWEHFTMHTGEYGYECTGCKAKRPRKQSTQIHINGQCKKRKKAKVKELYGFDRSITEIEAYICVLCNYIQLYRNNVEKHLQTQHDMSLYDSQSNIVRVSLIQFVKPYMETNDEENTGNREINNMNQNTDFMMQLSDCNSLNDTTKEFIEYSNLMQSSDDLSFTICNMLASDNFEPVYGTGGGSGNVPGNNDNILVKDQNK